MRDFEGASEEEIDQYLFDLRRTLVELRHDIAEMQLEMYERDDEIRQVEAWRRNRKGEDAPTS